MYEIISDRNQLFLFPYSLEDYVREDSPVRFINAFIDSLDLKELGLKVVAAIDQGRPPYSSEILTKALVYGYYKRVRSFRNLEEACRSDVNFIWLTGGHKPDHNTIWRFFKRNKKKLKELKKKSVKLAINAGMVDFVLHATDGCKIIADASKSKSLHKRDLKLIQKELDNHLDNYTKELYKENRKIESTRLELPDFLKNNEDRKKWIKKQLSEMNEEEKIGLLKDTEEKSDKLEEANTKHLSLSDPDCRMMKCEGNLKMSYNAQVVVDSKNQIIVSSDVIQEEADSHQLIDNIDDVKENTGRVGEETLADRGYFSGEELSRAEKNNYNVLVSIDKKTVDGMHSRESEFHQTNFIYNKKDNSYSCPFNGNLEYTAQRKSKRGHISNVYQCKDFNTCNHRWECSKSKTGRRIVISPFLENIENQLNRQKNIEKKDLLKQRIGIVEPIFAHIKHIMGFRRWTFRGLNNVKAQWNLLCLVHNLKKLYKLWKMGDLQFA